jgi:hypothetical protein
MSESLSRTHVDRKEDLRHFMDFSTIALSMLLTVGGVDELAVALIFSIAMISVQR